MKERKVETQNKAGETLVGIETLPDDSQEKYPAVILVHGFHVNKSEGGMFDEVARQLADRGIASYRFDFSGCGESEGDFSETTMSKMADDLRSITAFVKQQSIVDKSRLGILAQSLGVPITIMTQPQVNGIVLMGSSIQTLKTLTPFFGKGYNPKGISTKIRSSGHTTTLKPKFWKDLDSQNTKEDLQNIHSPILFIHGEHDEYIPISHVEFAYKSANDPKEMIILKNEPHWFDPKTSRMYDVAVGWMKNKLL